MTTESQIESGETATTTTIKINMADVILPAELETGTYANGMRIFVAEEDATLDFYFSYPVPGSAGMSAGSKVTSRVVVPRALLKKIVTALETAQKGPSKR